MRHELALPWRLSLPGSALELVVPGVAELEVAVDQLVDADDYRCLDVHGRRLRLVVAAHTLLHHQVIDQSWDVGRLRIWHGRTADGDPVLVERSDGVSVRALEFEPNGHRTPTPYWPHPLPAVDELLLEPAPVSPADFDRQWVLATQARAHRQYRSGWWGRFTDLSGRTSPPDPSGSPKR